MEQQTKMPHDGPKRDWRDLQLDPIMEPTEALPIQRGFFKTLFGTGYEYLGGLILVNILVSLQLLVGLAIGFSLGVLVHSAAVGLTLLVLLGGLFVAPALGGLFSYVRVICDPDMLSSLSEYWRGMRRYAVQSWILLAVQAISGGLLALNLRFYTSMHTGVGLVFTILILMLLLIWAMAGTYVWPLLVRGNSWAVLFRNSVLLALAAPFSTVAMLVALSAVSALLIAIRVGAVLLLFSVWALTENVSLVRLIRVFRARQEAQESSAGDGNATGA